MRAPVPFQAAQVAPCRPDLHLTLALSAGVTSRQTATRALSRLSSSAAPSDVTWRVCQLRQHCAHAARLFGSGSRDRCTLRRGLSPADGSGFPRAACARHAFCFACRIKTVLLWGGPRQLQAIYIYKKRIAASFGYKTPRQSPPLVSHAAVH